MEKPYKFMELGESFLVKYLQDIGMPEVLWDHVRLVFNSMEGKLEVVSLKEFGSVRMIPNPFAQIYSIAIGQLR
jgi:hypothetical protein